MSKDVRFNVVCGADDEQGENARIGVDGLNCGRIISHSSCFTPLRKGVEGMPKTKATRLLFCHSKVRVASGVINCLLALRTGVCSLRVSRLRLLIAASGDALVAELF